MDGTTKETNEEKRKIVFCVVASLLMIPLIVMNMIIAVNIYIRKQEVPAVGGFFPLISLMDEPSLDIDKGDFIVCKVIGEEDTIEKGDRITFFVSDSRELMCIAKVLSVNEDTVTLRSPGDENVYLISLDNVIGKYRSAIPLLGFVVYFLSTIPGFLIFVVLPTILLTELYLYWRRQDELIMDEEERALWIEFEKLKEEQEYLLLLSGVSKELVKIVAKNKKKTDFLTIGDSTVEWNVIL